MSDIKQLLNGICNRMVVEIYHYLDADQKCPSITPPPPRGW